jgi:hypothetical protein
VFHASDSIKIFFFSRFRTTNRDFRSAHLDPRSIDILAGYDPFRDGKIESARSHWRPVFLGEDRPDRTRDRFLNEKDGGLAPNG